MYVLILLYYYLVGLRSFYYYNVPDDWCIGIQYRKNDSNGCWRKTDISRRINSSCYLPYIASGKSMKRGGNRNKFTLYSVWRRDHGILLPPLIDHLLAIIILLLLLRRAFVSTETCVYANSAYNIYQLPGVRYIPRSFIIICSVIYIILSILFVIAYKHYSMWTVRSLYPVLVANIV